MSTDPIWLSPRIWFDEVERIGMRRCTPIGYTLNSIGGLVWLAGILALPATLVYLAYRGGAGTFLWSLLWLLTVPFLIVIAGSILIGLSWILAYGRKFHYDHELRESTWIKAGVQQTYNISDWQAEYR